LVIDEAKTYPSHELRLSYGDLQCDARAVAETKDVRLVDFQVPRKGRDIVRGGLERNGGIAIGGAAVRLLVQCDDSASAGKERKHSAERDLNGGPTPVKRDERNALLATMHFVVHVNAVDRSMAALERLGFKS
jgi:hypothetical protein